jgi:hypothetical protein
MIDGSLDHILGLGRPGLGRMRWRLMQTHGSGGGAGDDGGTGDGIGILWGCLLSLPIWYGLYLLVRWCFS